MTKKILLFLLLATLIIPATASADTSTPPAIGELSQLLGISNDDIKAELAAGKTALQIAVEHGMRKEVYLKRVGAAKSVVKTAAKKVVKKASAKPVKKVPPKTIKPVKK